MDSEQADYIALSRVCDDLGITPSHLRDIIAEFGDIIGAAPNTRDCEQGDGSPPWKALLEDDWLPGIEAESPQQEGEAGGRPGPGLPPESVEAIAIILKMRAEGASNEQVREALSSEAGSMSASERVDLTLEKLARELAQTEKRRAEDRDRLLTALMRTHQEVRQLRNELAAQSSRRSRKKESFLSRLFGL